MMTSHTSAVRYDAETDLREQREAKEKQLKQVDETKKRAEIKGGSQLH